MNQRLYIIAALLFVAAPMFSGTTTAQIKSDVAIYEKRCGGCHGVDAKRLAQITLRTDGDKIVTREKAVELKKFLNRHGRSTPSEIRRIYSLLRRHLATENPQ